MSESNDKPDEEYSEKHVEVTIRKNEKDDQEKQKLEAELAEEKERRASTEASLEIIAQNEFLKRKAEIISRAKRVGLTIDPESIPDEEPEKLIAYADIVKQREALDKAEAEDRRKHTAPYGTPLTGAQYGDQSQKPLRERTYEDLEAMFDDLETEASKGNPEAREILTELGKKKLKKDFNAEFQGNISDAYRLAHTHSSDPEKEAELGEKARKEKRKWKES